MKATWCSALAVLLAPLAPTLADPPKKDAGDLPTAVTKPLPESLDDLKAIQAQTRKVIQKVIPATVGVRIGGASGSGVIVSKEGLVLTAGHVSGKPGQKCTFILSDGKEIKGESLGRNERIDSGMFKITTPGDWPYAEMGKSEDLKPGQWCIAIGHPNGYVKGRTPVVRLGRVLNSGKTSISTDCTLVGGDSGGPLFDMEGKVVGIHSRIGGTISANIHVPVYAYRDQWEQLVKGDEIVPGASVAINAYLGVTRDEDARECKLSRVTEGSPAEKGGMKAGDVITRFDGKDVKSYDDLLGVLAKKKPGDEVEVLVKRGEETKSLKVKLDKRG
jgi:serine protease Do